MPRFYFHLRYDHESSDGEGVDLPDFSAAWAEAVRACGEMLEELEGSLDPDIPFEMTIADSAVRPICLLRFTAEFLRPPV